jgi:hypothetical protein
MGLVSVCPARRFLDGLNIQHVQAGTRVLLSAFFEAMHARTVYLESGVSPRIKALAEAATGIPVLALGDEVDTQRGRPKANVLPIEAAIEESSARMTQLQELPNVSAGISFGLDQEPNSPKNRWGLVLHRGPLPLLELRISDGSRFEPPDGWAECLIRNGSAHVVWVSGKGYVGGADHLYLFLKNQKLFPYSKGESSGGAIEAGQYLRRSCQEVWSKHSGEKAGPYKLSSWRWSQKLFVRNFDKMLIAQIGSEELAGVLKAMGTDLENWLPACG